MPAHASALPVPGGYVYRRHALPVRVMHWLNVVALTILLMSGLSIFNAHPALYWGKSSYTGRPPLLSIRAVENDAGTVIGQTTILGHPFETTGVLGVSADRDGDPVGRGFPWWLTIPDDQWLSMARAWHFFFAWLLVLNGLAYLLYGVASRHFKRTLAPTATELRGIGASIVEHLRFRHAEGEAATRYNVLQKLAYLVVIFVLLPGVVLMGLGMSPWFNGVWPGWVDLVGGRQSARTIHFVCAWLLVLFAAVHVFHVVLGGLWNNLRSMITGRYRVTTATDAPKAADETR
jgi:thiosulfate reductase cytochrome b subunit